MSDRIVGGVLCLVSVWYVWAAAGYGATFGDPLGPSAFPQIVGVPAIIFSLSLVLRPDPDPAWPRGAPLARHAAAVGAMVAYALLLETLGFVLATFCTVLVLGWLLGAGPRRAVVSAAVMAPALFLLFDQLLGLPLQLLPGFLDA